MPEFLPRMGYSESKLRYRYYQMNTDPCVLSVHSKCLGNTDNEVCK